MQDLKSVDPCYARMPSSFAYSAFAQALSSACLRRGVALVRHDPSYTLIIGCVKFARRYGLSVHEAASVTISERLPGSLTLTLTVPTNGSVHVTLDLPVRTSSRYVWPQWNGVNKEHHKKALAALHQRVVRRAADQTCHLGFVPRFDGVPDGSRRGQT